MKRLLSGDDVKALAGVARKINDIPSPLVRFTYILRICVENAQLLMELNEHREARGLDPLPVYDPKEMR